MAAEDARFRQHEIARGLLPLAGATLRAPVQVGWGNAMRWLLTGDEFDAAEAFRIGLVQEVVAAGDQLTRAVEIAETIAQQAPLGVQGTLANARIAWRQQVEHAAREHLRQVMPAVMASEDLAEGVCSFAERRPGRFQGR